MTTTASTPLTTSPDLPDDDAQSEAPRHRGRLSRGLLAATGAAVVAITGGVFWLTAGSGGDEPHPDVVVVEDGTRYGSADSLERQSGSASDGTQYGSADSFEHRSGDMPDGSQFGPLERRAE